MSPRRPKLPGKTIDRLDATYKYLLGKNKHGSERSEGANINRDVRNTLVPLEVREDMARMLENASQLGLCVGKLSEASIQLQENQFLVSKKGSWFHDIADSDLVFATGGTDSIADGNQTPVYWEWHLGVYSRCKTTKAIILGQPAAVMALAKRKRMPDEGLLVDAGKALGPIIFCQPDLNEISQYAEQSNLLVIEGIGILSQGETLFDALINLEILNRWSESTLLADS